jgi:rhodanese-related sulfurtransferase
MILFDRAAPTRWAYRDIDPRSAYEAREQLLLVDVREPDEFARGHIPRARLISLSALGAALRGWDPMMEIILVCRSGQRSGTAAEAMASAGFHRVMNLAGGMLAYEAAGLPVERAHS